MGVVPPGQLVAGRRCEGLWGLGRAWGLDGIGGGAGGCRGRAQARIKLHGSESLIEGIGLLLGHRDLQGGIGEWIPHALFSPSLANWGPSQGAPLSFITFRLVANNLFQNKKHNKCKTLE